MGVSFKVIRLMYYIIYGLPKVDSHTIFTLVSTLNRYWQMCRYKTFVSCWINIFKNGIHAKTLNPYQLHFLSYNMCFSIFRPFSYFTLFSLFQNLKIIAFEIKRSFVILTLIHSWIHSSIFICKNNLLPN